MREDAAYSRENAAKVRENAVHLRERAVCVREREAGAREEAATAREEIIRETVDRVETASGDHVSMMQQANSELIVSVIEAQKLAEQIEASKTRLQHLAHHDVLTGLPNRMLLQDRLSQAIELARRQSRRFAVLFMDLDRFKHINDSLGHAAGDQLLQSVAQRLSDCVRHSDTVSRRGGDEFVVLLSNIMHAEDAATHCKNMLIALSAPHRIDHHDMHVSASIGIGIYPDDGQDAETCSRVQTSRCTMQKKTGAIILNSLSINECSGCPASIHRIQSAMRTGARGILLVLPAEINLQSNMMSVLRRSFAGSIRNGAGAAVPVCAIAEDCGLILPIGPGCCAKLPTGCAWREAGLPPITVAVNTSTLEFSARIF